MRVIVFALLLCASAASSDPEVAAAWRAVELASAHLAEDERSAAPLPRFALSTAGADASTSSEAKHGQQASFIDPITAAKQVDTVLGPV